jgi:hypothetical protein
MVSVTPRPRFTPGESTPGTHWASEPVWKQRLEEKHSASVGDRTPVVQSVVRHYTNWATPGSSWVIVGILKLFDDDDQWRYSPDRALASLPVFMIVCSTMWGYQLHDRPALDTLIQPSETSSSNYQRLVAKQGKTGEKWPLNFADEHLSCS